MELLLYLLFVFDTTVLMLSRCVFSFVLTAYLSIGIGYNIQHKTVTISINNKLNTFVSRGKLQRFGLPFKSDLDE